MKKSLHSKKACIDCDHCQYIGDGDYFCDEHNEIVLTEHATPTDGYMCCRGRDFEK